MSNDAKMEGGCLCGAVRYRVSGLPFAAEYCHCRMCQKAAGAVAVSWMDFHKEQVQWMEGQPVEYESSENGRRGFCGQCGSNLSFRNTRYPEYLTLAIASLDDPSRVKPTYHIYTESQVAWLKIQDDCPRFPKGPVKPSE